jgi:hypothetical protein
MLQLIKDCIWAWRYKSKVREARKLALLFNMTFFVFMMNGKLKVAPKRVLKDLVRRGRFKRGTTIQDIEKTALFIARPSNTPGVLCS